MWCGGHAVLVAARARLRVGYVYAPQIVGGSMRRLWGSAVLVVLLGHASPALAQGGLAAEGPYIAGSVGAALIRLDIDDVDLIDDTTIAWKAGLGYRGRYFAVEVDYRSLRELTAAFPGADLTASTTGFQGSMMLILPAGPVDLFGRGGWFRWKHESGIAAEITETKGTDFAYGVGIALRLGTFSLRAEYERFQVDFLRDLQMVTAGITIGF